MDINNLWSGYDLNSKKQNSRCAFATALNRYSIFVNGRYFFKGKNYGKESEKKQKMDEV